MRTENFSRGVPFTSPVPNMADNEESNHRQQEQNRTARYSNYGTGQSLVKWSHRTYINTRAVILKLCCVMKIIVLQSICRWKSSVLMIGTFSFIITKNVNVRCKYSTDSHTFHGVRLILSRNYWSIHWSRGVQSTADLVLLMQICKFKCYDDLNKSIQKITDSFLRNFQSENY